MVLFPKLHASISQEWTINSSSSDFALATTLPLGSTIIGHGVKLDNLIQIAHNVEIGSDTVIAAQTGIAGSSKIGARCKIGGQVGIIGHLTIGDDVQIQGQTGVINDVANKDIIQGTPAIDFRSFYKSYSIFKNLPNFESRISKFEIEDKESTMALMMLFGTSW